MYTFIDLFCGIGGFRVALERKGMRCVFSSDIDTHAQKVYERNFGEKPHGDITEVNEKDIPKHDILCAGFPCQSFSISGKRDGFDGKTGLLFDEIVRITRYHKPKLLLLENVRNILSIDNGAVIQYIKKQLIDIGYTLHYSVLNASDFGIPTTRKRVYFIGFFNGKYTEPKPTNETVVLDDIIEVEDPQDKTLYIDKDTIIFTKEQIERVMNTARIGGIKGHGGQGQRVYSPKGCAVTFTANGGGQGAKTGLYLINNKVRKLTHIECKRVMGFSDTHIVSDGVQGYKQIGNTVIPKMIELVFDGVTII